MNWHILAVFCETPIFNLVELCELTNYFCVSELKLGELALHRIFAKKKAHFGRIRPARNGHFSWSSLEPSSSSLGARQPPGAREIQERVHRTCGARATCTLLDLFSCASLVTDSEVLAQLALVDGLATTRSSVNPWGRNILAPALRTSKNYHASAKFWSFKRLYLAGPYASVNADPPTVRAAAATAAMCCHAVLS